MDYVFSDPAWISASSCFWVRCLLPTAQATYDPVVTLSQSCGHSPSWLHSEITLSSEKKKQCPAPCPEFDVIRLTAAILIDIRVGNPHFRDHLPLRQGDLKRLRWTLFHSASPWYLLLSGLDMATLLEAGFSMSLKDPSLPFDPSSDDWSSAFFPCGWVHDSLIACFLTVFGSPELFIF